MYIFKEQLFDVIFSNKELKKQYKIINDYS